MRSLNELKKAYPGKKIRIPEIFEINGEVLHSKEETALAMGVTSRTLTNWVNRPHVHTPPPTKAKTEGELFTPYDENELFPNSK